MAPKRERDERDGEGSVVLAPSHKLVMLPPPRAVLGCIQIPTDLVMDREGPKLVEKFAGVELRIQKLSMPSEDITADTFKKAESNVGLAAATLLPSGRCTVVGLSCTSMSFSLGPSAVDAQLQGACPGALTTDMARAQAAALHAIGAKCVSLLTPYIEAVAAANERTLESCGVLWVPLLVLVAMMVAMPLGVQLGMGMLTM